MSKIKQRFRILISYKGLKYYGWQRQTNLPTIQGTMEAALKKIFQKDIPVIGAGRTDTGAHALGQTAHFDLSVLPKFCLQKALNSFLLPKDICVRQVWKAPSHFHALHSAIGKHYMYFILNRPFLCVFRRGQIYWHPYQMDINLLQKISQTISGRHDFKSFQNAGTSVKSTIRTITSAHWKREKKQVWIFEIQGKGFLKQMIRNIVGTQLALLKEKEPLKKWNDIFHSKDRKTASTTAPALGLYLYKVSYPPELDKECQKFYAGPACADLV
ncbi:MAG: tRNA pseudouridine(38-40) synthase TruA [Bdellovibrionales bacterium]|nr:tRNA pseudouridine(38-40) synthase TruA [Bdellovibrionales bacterium]